MRVLLELLLLLALLAAVGMAWSLAARYLR
jgi:hypothetical protein